MKKIFILFFVLLACVEAINGALIDGVYYDLNKSSRTATVVGGDNLSHIVIPSTIDYYDERDKITYTYLVTKIRWMAFYNCQNLTSVTIGSNVTTIEGGAFELCTNLSSINLPSGITSIEYETFKGCISLVSINIPGNVTSIGYEAFLGCSSLSSIDIPNSVTSIGKSAFQYCSGLKSLTFKNSATNIGQSAFADCTSLSMVSFGNSISNIGESAFANCISLTSVNIPNSITRIGNYAFSGCSNLSFVEIPNSVTNIGGGAFRGCGSLSTIEIPSSVTTIGDEAFCECGSLSSVDVPDNVTIIEPRVFENCTSLASVSLGNNVTRIWNDAFYNCSSLKIVTIPNSVTSIEGAAFYGCTNLESLTIGTGVTNIGEVAFAECNNLTSVTINSNHIVSKDYKWSSSIIDIFGSQVMTYIIGDSVTSIGRHAFSSYPNNLTSTIVGKNVTAIGNCAFYGCGDLTSAEISNGVTHIGDSAFSDCRSLTSIKIPNRCEGIGKSAFSNCDGMTSVDLGEGVKEIGEGAFGHCEKLTHIEIPNRTTSIGTGAFYHCTNLSSLNLGSGVTNIGKDAFSWCRNLTKVTIGNKIQNIGNAFTLCNVTEMNFSGTVEEWCSKVWNIQIITGENFYSLYINNIKADNIVIPDNVGEIPEYAFKNCNNINSISIGDGVVNIGRNAFYDCRNLRLAKIGKSVSSIGVGAFANCITLDTIYNNAETPQPIEDNVFWGVNKSNCRLIVPTGSLALYKAADVWKEFLIEEKLCIADYGMCGEYVGWTVNCDSTELWIEGSGVMSDGAPWAEYYGSIRKIILDKGITRIGAGAFAGASIAKITIPGKVNSLGAGAVSGCSSLSSIVCEAVTPPICDANVFAGVNKSIPLVIPERSREAYKAADQWKDFFPTGDSQEITGPDTIPTVEEVTQLYPLTGNNLVVCLYFDVAPCNDVYFPGNYRMNASGGWSTDINELERFEPLPGYPGWYVVEVPYMNNAQGKPVQLRSDDIFDWEYQSGDANAWINHGTYVASVIQGYPGEADIYYPVPGCYIYELVYWKNHKSPCTVVPKHDYTIQLYAPDACEEMKPAIVGTFNNWSIFVPMTETTDLHGRKEYTFTIYDEEGHLFRFADSEYGWSNQLQYYDLEYGYWQNFDNYILPETDQDTTLVFDYSDNGKYRFATCENNVPTIPSGINNAISEKDEPRKLLRDGQILILRGEKVYTLQGVEVK